MSPEYGEHIPQREIRSWFVIREVPAGGAPQHIKEQWLNLPLPLRYDRPAEDPDPMLGASVSNLNAFRTTEDGILITPEDSVKVLRLFGRDEAADYWQQFFDDVGLAADGLIFNNIEGELMSPDEINSSLPGIENFDRI